MFEPQRHRGTEKTQSHSPTSQTRRHEGTKTSQWPPTDPPIQPTDHTDEHRCLHSRLNHAARSWPPNGGQGPLGRATAPIASDRRGSPAQRPALSERKPRHSSFPSVGWKVTPLPNRNEGRRNRRAPSASAGGAFGRDKRSRLERTNVPPVVGDRTIAASSAVNLRHCRITSATNPSCLRVFVFATWAGDSAPPRLCVFCSVSLLCVSVSLWFSRFRTVQRS